MACVKRALQSCDRTVQAQDRRLLGEHSKALDQSDRRSLEVIVAHELTLAPDHNGVNRNEFERSLRP